ncbi:peptidylprolyl isomerase [Alysiella filiformis]|uniref:peptidylprolyl isomerase n=1 Tax=Alysiella filiformis DSM 16848 TaxID=1120981 RepID=A0A286EGB0_9NEIS|nr:peptidyl-prolyl cis-trans isomerase [Alysiella filiformis]QMT30522.1 peptidyl-prolyl cis-trans isomerase [Alysiella filiformis]UBQ56498.1 peptidyl-prolyl cis-trans isomerase [Alysiella filiformis DSM 16848]SOD69938.1 peptidyl-prolyl cis-trans isomerase C [Alysiella filiformis DSM 16848]
MMKKNQIVASLTMLLVSGSLLAQTVLTVNGNKIDSSDIERRAKNLQINSQGQIQDSPQVRQYVTNELITETLVAQEAKRLKLDKTETYKQAEAEALKEIKAKGLDKEKNFKQNWADLQNHFLMMAYANHIISTEKIDPNAVQKEYTDYQKRYQGSDEVQLGEILTNDAKQAEAALKDLNGKKSFVETMKKYSIDEEVKAAGGIVPEYVPLVDLKESNEQIYQAVADLNKGQHSKKAVSANNLHLILYVNDKRQIQVPTFEEMKPHIEQRLREEQISRAVDELSAKAKIEPAQ